ncbi:hypothetical protein HAHE_09300 [Haloferula helveola]|uniref:Uncharacterized protein n=1 Tax=Haloferula helveola TaxID=490095 RepID=A0ABN6H0G1_9BACT|nr:hypothetical protein HAHE_09300 [Haloferula helveola]
MTAWDTDDYGGIMGILLGIIVLVFGGITVSLVIERRTEGARSGKTLEADIARDANQILDLKSEIITLEKRWESNHQPNLGQDGEITALRDELNRTVAERSKLHSDAENLREDLADFEEDAQEYRRRYRIQARADVIGQAVEALKLPNGRSYRDVTIRKCGPEGIHIHHSGGSARVAYSDLPTEWKDRLQWHPVEEELPAVVQEQPKPEDGKAGPKPDSDRDAEREKEALRQTRIQTARDSMRRYHADYLDARRMASTARSRSLGSDRSVPGSLETWEERALRMDQVAAKARSLFIQARTELATLNPRDRLLSDPRYRLGP